MLTQTGGLIRAVNKEQIDLEGGGGSRSGAGNEKHSVKEHAATHAADDI